MVMRWYRQWERSQALIILPSTIIVAGILGLILGSGAARSFGNLGGPIVVRVTAFFLFVGGIMVLVGMIKHRSLIELSGLAMGTLGAALYGFGTLIGFGTGGAMSGVGWVGIASVLFERVLFALSRARARDHIKESL